MLPRLRSFALSLTRARDTADDLVQQTCEKGLSNLAGFQPGTRLDAWLFRIMRNTWIDTVRARKEAMPLDDLTEGAELMGEDGRRTSEDRLHLAEVRRAIARLPEDQRAVLLLVCVDGLRYREVAAALDIPEGTVMSRLSRARLALAAELNRTEEPAARRGNTP